MTSPSDTRAIIGARAATRAAVASETPAGYEPWQAKLQRLIDAHNRDALRKHKIISSKTREERARTLFLCFRQLREDGYKLADPANLKPKHIEVLMKRWEREGLSGSTLQCRLSVLSALANWIGKPGMIRAPGEYLEDPNNAKRSYVAKVDKSWSATDVDIEAKIAEVAADDVHVGMQLMVISAFGLRRKEGVMFQPFRAHKMSDGGGEYIELTATSGTKGGRARVVPVTNDYQRRVLADAKKMAGTAGNHIGNPKLDLQQALARFSNLMTKHGVTKKMMGSTAHGLRHQYLNDRYAEIAGMPSPVRGGVVTPETKEADLLARYTTTEEAGHSRLQVTTGYYGSSSKA